MALEISFAMGMMAEMGFGLVASRECLDLEPEVLSEASERASLFKEMESPGETTVRVVLVALR